MHNILVRPNEKLYQHFQGSSEATSVHLIKNFGEHAPRHLAHIPLWTNHFQKLPAMPLMVTMDCS